jgi:hypothetical protein
MNLNKDQRDGLAKITDNLATAVAAAVVLTGFIEGRIPLAQLGSLLMLFLTFVTFGLYLRKERPSGT